ncbi:fatty acid cis/trans isomerase CTI [Bacteriovorax stolpii]|uniref:fatty acid cis/trans isomerase n=1 Tax=Bacteriovorax stolpii TaxID=960 RepID=UPI0010DE330E|nr:fatty acid cis/trans isomerase [Bacteriovorax stolpii]TDP51686.1 fatty acid cis/trans isomerase CTI [Bacteriovorax stolpii]
MKIIFTLLSLCSSLVFAQDYRKEIQPIFDNRCIACHSCLNGPCQVNLQNYDNFSRGAHHKNVYEGTRIDSVPPTRPGIDGKTLIDWRKLGFFDTNTSRDLDENLFYLFLGTKPLTQRDLPLNTVEESVACIDNTKNLKALFAESLNIKMPYALQPITEKERMTLGTWLANGAPGPKTLSPPKETQSQVREWENFFNQKSEKEKLVSRYLYEHLFLAHIYFPEKPTDFYRLVRSETKCDKGISEIATRRANDTPGMKEFFYCLKHQDLTIVAKTHMPFSFTPKVMERFKQLFFSTKWEVNKKAEEEKYTSEAAENPFIAFFDIPVKARYQFLLDNAHYIISTFIKGPVCNGSNAVNSIQEQFYVMFISPESDNMVLSKEFEAKARDLLILPGVWGSDIKLADTWGLTKKIVEHREGYRNLRALETKKNHPHGYALSDLWDGDGQNSNAALTVLRHNDNAVVIKGFKGDLPKTLFFLDYALMERLVYNLVVNFDVYGNISHQMLTRIYMDLIRMEAEEMFLSFLPPQSRMSYRKEWYKGFLAEAKLKYVFPLLDTKTPTQVKYKNPKHAKSEFVEQVLYGYLKDNVKGPADFINWKNVRLPLEEAKKGPLTPAASHLRDISAVKPKGKFRFPTFFPEDAYLVVTKENKEVEVFTVMKNREHENISWILGESLRLAPKEDTLTILAGFYSYYPNLFFKVKETDLVNFKNQVLKISNINDYKELKKKYAVSRVAPDFWETYDLLNAVYRKDFPIEAGHLDLTRYVME